MADETIRDGKTIKEALDLVVEVGLWQRKNRINETLTR